jgi:transposase InsO family protein
MGDSVCLLSQHKHGRPAIKRKAWARSHLGQGQTLFRQPRQRAATFKGHYKASLINRRAPWKTKESLELAALEEVSWFIHHRLLESIEYIPPAEAEDNYYR